MLRIPADQEDTPGVDGLQVLRYQERQAYISHTDYFEPNQVDDFDWDPETNAHGSNRFATIFFYLSNVEAGGQTAFPHADALPGNEKYLSEVALADNMDPPLKHWEKNLVKTCYNTLNIRPRKGTAILFYSQKPSFRGRGSGGALDPMSFHAGCPVLKGEKWAANLWVWNGGLFADTTKMTVVFKNNFPDILKVFWLSLRADGHEERFLSGQVDPGQNFELQTYVGHYFLLTTAPAVRTPEIRRSPQAVVGGYSGNGKVHQVVRMSKTPFGSSVIFEVSAGGNVVIHPKEKKVHTHRHSHLEL